jgi:molybdate transport system substrate-binding protein
MAACADDGGDRSARDAQPGAAGTIHTVAPLEGVATRLLEAYETLDPDADLALKVSPPAQAVQAVAERTGGVTILPTAALADVDSTALGRTLAIIAVPAGNPGQVTGVAAFAAGSGQETAMCGPDTIFGNFAALVVHLGGVEPDPDRVRSGCAGRAMDRVARGELDAALVFRTAVRIPDGVEVIELPEDQNLIIEIAYARLANSESARAFVRFLGSDPAKLILADEGFLP